MSHSELLDFTLHEVRNYLQIILFSDLDDRLKQKTRLMRDHLNMIEELANIDKLEYISVPTTKEDLIANLPSEFATDIHELSCDVKIITNIIRSMIRYFGKKKKLISGIITSNSIIIEFDSELSKDLLLTIHNEQLISRFPDTSLAYIWILKLGWILEIDSKRLIIKNIDNLQFS